MRLNHIQTGTPMTLLVTQEEEKNFRSRFVDNSSDSIYYVYCQDVLSDLDRYIGQIITVEFSISERLFRTESRIIGKGGNRKSYDTVTLELLSEFQEQRRRAHDRYDFQVITKIFNYSDNIDNDYRGTFICDSVSADISKHGIRLLANRKLDCGDHLYTLEFAVKPGSLFSIYAIPAKLVRVSRSVSVFSAAYDYGFSFDFTNKPGIEEKLFNDLFELRLAGAFR